MIYIILKKRGESLILGLELTLPSPVTFFYTGYIQLLMLVQYFSLNMLLLFLRTFFNVSIVKSCIQFLNLFCPLSISSVRAAISIDLWVTKYLRDIASFLVQQVI